MIHKAEVARDSYTVLKEEFDLYDKVQDIGVKQVSDLMLDPAIKKVGMAEAYVLKTLGIPGSYYRKVNESHKKELLSNAQKTYPAYGARVLVKEREFLAAGPQVAMQFATLPDFIEEKVPGELVEVIGSAIHNPLVRICKKHSEEEIEEMYYLGLDMEITPLFAYGMAFRPKLFQVVCKNGMVQTTRLPGEMSIPYDKISAETLEVGIAMAMGVLEKKGPFFTLLKRLEKTPPIQSKLFGEQVIDFPKSFVDKSVNLLGRVEEGQVTGLPVPRRMNSLRDNVSVLTYVAQDFSTKTRYNLEAKIYSWAQKRVK